MKKLFHLLFAFFMIFAMLTTFANVHETSNGPVPRAFGGDRGPEIGIYSEFATIAYGHSSIQLSTLSMPLPSGTPFTLMSPWTAPGFASSMAKGGDGNFYITEIAPALYQFNPSTGAVTLLGSITGMGADQPNGIKYNPANGQYYIVSSANFYSFNITTRVATLIGAFNVAGGLMIDLCFNPAGTCFAYDLGVDNAYTINLATGNATLLGTLGYDANFGQGMSYDYELGTIYLSAFNNGTFTGQLRTMDPATGMTTLVVDWGFDQVAPFHTQTNIVPVELTSFSAIVNQGNVVLNWTTATETNNQGFEVERSNGNEFFTVGSITGHGTTTEIQNYTFTDRNVPVGNYSYRLKQFDFDGRYDYSDLVEIEVIAPAEFALDQNYPNPFNPSTKITFKLAVDSKVSLKVFDLLGQEVMTIINNDLTAGSHQVDFSANNLNSGVYFYKIEATGNDGSSFSDVKKMTLTK
jgi:hypothetical protein